MRRPRTPKGNYAFIDSQNLNLGVQKMGWKMDWRKFRAWLRDEHNVTHAFMFIGYMPNYEELYTQMHDLGFLVVLKPTLEMYAAPEVVPSADEAKQAADMAAHAARVAHAGKGTENRGAESKNGAPGKGAVSTKPEERTKPAVKGNIDAEMVLYAMKEMPNYHKAILVSGDGDFYCLVEYLDEQKKLLSIMAPNRQYSTLFRPFERYVVRIDQLRGTLAYRDFKRRRPSRPADGNGQAPQNPSRRPAKK